MKTSPTFKEAYNEIKRRLFKAESLILKAKRAHEKADACESQVKARAA